MNYPPCPFHLASESGEEPIYSFRSESAEKQILKLVFLTDLGDRVYNLALVDLNDDGELSDTIVSNNQDLETVLATVIRIVLDFLQTHPDATVLIRGSTPSRTRLYRIVIATYFDELSLHVRIEGQFAEIREPFQPNRPYERFFIRKHS